MIVLNQVSKSFDGGNTYKVKQLQLSIQSGETLALLGSSGSGKTTLLKMINRLIDPTSGEILIDGNNIQTIDKILLRRAIGYVIQHIGLFPHLTIMENMCIVLKLSGVSRKKQLSRAHTLFQLVNLDAAQFAHCYPSELSGGQQQRIGVARALAADPHILLMDEPFGALDAITRADLQNELLILKKQLQKTIIIVTHDIQEAVRLADRIAILHEGQLEQVDTPDNIFNHPASDFVKTLLSTHRQTLTDRQSDT